MKRTLAERVADVRRLVDAARAIAPRPALRDALVQTTHLSRQGVELALSEHLETSPSEADLVRLVESAGDAPRVHVVLSANVFVGALRALAIARAAAPRVTVAPSRREPTFARALILEAGDPALRIEDALAVDAIRAGEIHLYGRDDTIADVRAHAASGVRVKGHGSGLGVACVSSKADLDVAASALAKDVVAFDQRGCLSPRVVFVQGDAQRGEALSSKLHDALAEAEERVPRGELAKDELEQAARYASALGFVGQVWRGASHLVGLASTGTPNLLAPTGRHVHVAVVSDMREARELLAPLVRFVAAVGFDDPAFGGELTDRAVRASALGWMQRPALDGPVDLRGEDELGSAIRLERLPG
jgi:hypothetical protein